MVKRRHIVLTITLVLLLLGSNVHAAVPSEQGNRQTSVEEVEWFLSLFPDHDHSDLTVHLLDKPMFGIKGVCVKRPEGTTITLGSDAGLDVFMHEYAHYIDNGDSYSKEYKDTLEQQYVSTYKWAYSLQESFAEDFKEFMILSTRKEFSGYFYPRKNSVYSFNYHSLTYFDRKFPDIYENRMEMHNYIEPIIVEQE